MPSRTDPAMGAPSSEAALLMDVRTHRGELAGNSVCLDKEIHVRSLIWEWLSFQDPLVGFPAGTEALPGQDHPGLGIFRVAVDLMLDYVEEMDIDALVGLPQYFHNAVLYSSQFRFQARIGRRVLRAASGPAGRGWPGPQAVVKGGSKSREAADA